jgi:hypothetical protein
MQSFRADPDKSFRPISLFGETIILSHIAADSVGGILWGASSAPGGLQTPQGSRSGALETRFFSLEARALLLEQFPAYFDGLNFWTSFPAGSGYHTLPESHIFVDLSVHASDLLSSSDHGYFYVI